MTGAESISVWDALKELGFSPDSAVLSDEKPGLSFDFGNFRLEAGALTNKWFRPVIIFGGLLTTMTPRKIAEVEVVDFELPRIVASRQQLKAFLTYYLDNAAGGVFHPTRNVDWLSEGRRDRHLLPWEIAAAAYRARPHCIVRRDWLRLALKDLGELLMKTDEETEVEFSFDGSVLLIKCSENVVAVSAHGKPWNPQFTIPAGNLRNLPKRLLRDNVELSVREGRLHIGRACFDGAKPAQRASRAAIVQRDRGKGTTGSGKSRR